ncbi:neutral zinc metallopeptidase [Saccharopolyspora sp. MS10]|uniref:neutral zinc metallopeptidase n=1 Tax=Saccharopolyspora sp. MS10 TaxID=3385973 RepID=UPI0039A030DF
MRTRRIGPLLAALLALTVLAGCAPTGPETPAPEPVGADPGFVHGTDGGATDRLAAAVIGDVQDYWAATFPPLSGHPWRDLDGGFFSVDTARGGDRPPPCSGDVANLEGNAYYCASVDAIAWDRAALLPVLREHYGDAAVAVVLAHEFGHAVQQRLGMAVGGGADAAAIEAGADCYAGAFLRTAADGRTAHLRVGPGELDRALHALIVFRDPIGTEPAAADAHGTSFARITAFQQGFQDGPADCAAVSPVRAPTTETGEDATETFPGTVEATGRRAAEFFGGLVTAGGRSWSTPAPRPGGCAAAPVGLCDGATAFDPERLGAVHHDIGDQATATLLASRYALAARTALGRPNTGPAAGNAISCLTGAYTAGEPRLSAGDLDEAVEALLTEDAAGRDARGAVVITGAQRVAAFRTGLLRGPDACG